jgi:hypothetical protein
VLLRVKKVAKARNVAIEKEVARYQGMRLSLILNGYLIIKMRSTPRQVLSITVAKSSQMLKMFDEMSSVYNAAY